MSHCQNNNLIALTIFFNIPSPNKPFFRYLPIEQSEATTLLTFPNTKQNTNFKFQFNNFSCKHYLMKFKS